MSLVEIPVRQLHQGVSRQPDHVHFPGQLQDATNCIFRVEEAGFSKRFGSVVVAPVSFTAGTTNINFQVIDFFSNSKLGISFGTGGQISVVDLLTGTTRAINTLSGPVLAYLGSDPSKLVVSAVYGTTLILNTSVTVAMKSSTSAAAVTNRAVFQIVDGRPGIYTVTIDGTSGSYTTIQADQTTWDTSHIASQIVGTLASALGGGYLVTTLNGGYIGVQKSGGGAMSVSTSDPTGGLSIRSTIEDTFITNTDLLPAYAFGGMRVFVGAPSAPTYYVKFTSTPGSANGYWSECLGPSVSYSIDPATMPLGLFVEADNSVTVSQLSWGDLQVGDTTTVPPPDFVGRTISDVVFHKNRLGILTGEWVWFSTAGDYFNFWPKFSTQALDTDPFGLRGSSNRVSYLRFGVPYRKVFWTTSDNGQFEVSTATTLTATNAVMDYTTGYTCNPQCRPVTMAQMLYFTSWNGGNAILEEYSFDYFTLTSVANDVTRHVRGYIPSQVVDMTADQPTGNLFILSGTDRSSIFAWTVYWNQTQREQSCWSQWNFTGCTIHGIRVADGILYMCITRANGTWIEKIALAENSVFFVNGYSPRLDQLQLLTGGTYDAANNRTPFTLNYGISATGGVIVDFSSGAALTISGVTGSTIYVTGNHQGSSGIAGFPFQSSITLSKQFLRDQQGTAVLNGVLLLQTFTVAHKDTGYYEVEIDVPGRAPIVQKFAGTQLINTGTFRGTAQGEGQTAAIKINNNTHLPHSISEIVFRGEFNELVRQG